MLTSHQNHSNMEEIDPDAGEIVDVEDFNDDDELNQKHDQLPQSGEGIKQDLDLCTVEERRNKRRWQGWWWKILVGVLISVLIVVLVVVFIVMPRGNAAHGSSGSGSNASPSPSPNDSSDNAAPSSTLESVEALLREIALDGGSEFDNPRSYQSKAKAALLNDPLVTERSEQKLAQRYALLCVYYATNRVQTDVTDKVFGLGTVPKWHDFQHWKYHDIHECQWHGITCDKFDFVTEIDLHQNGLTGKIPREITLLWKRLKRLSLDSNQGLGQGGVPWFLAEFGELTTLDLRGCSYAGEMPASLCGLVKARGILDIQADCSDSSGDDNSSSSPALTCSCCANC